MALQTFANGEALSSVRAKINANAVKTSDDLAVLAISLGQITAGNITLTETQWDVPSVGTNTITNGNGLNLLTLISDANLNNTNSDTTGRLSISAGNYIMTDWVGGKMIHNVRLSLEIKTGGQQHYQVNLKRQSDNSIVSSYTIERNQDEPAQTIEFTTRTLSATDPYVTDGFYIELVNNSGQSCTIEDGMQLVIISNYQYLKTVD